MFVDSRVRSLPLLAAAAIATVHACAGSAPAQSYVNHVLTDNICCEEEHTDPRLLKAWGLAFAPTGAAWVTANFAGRAELFDGDGNPQTLSVQLEVQPFFNGGFATGIAFTGGNNFLVSNNAGAVTPARFLFVAQEGTLLAWTPRPAPAPQNTFAPFIQNNFERGDRYTGVAIARDVGAAGRDLVYIADIGHARIRVLDGSYAPVDLPFTDRNLPAGYAPFNVRVLGGRVFVAYGPQDSDKLDVVSGPGNGIVDSYTLDGVFVSRVASHGVLNAPWGMTIAPANFGKYSGALLVGNFGDGRINAFNRDSGALLGTLTDTTGAAISIDGLHGIEFGNGRPTQANNTLYYAAAPTFGVVGVFGRVDQACRSDVTQDGRITVDDVFDLLAAWFGGSARADINGDNTLSVQDLFDFLRGYFVGCP